MSQTDRRSALLPSPFQTWFALLLVALSASPVPGADWPHLRGPQYDAVSVETGLADSWPAAGPPQLWSSDLGQGWSGFIGAEGKVYTQRQTLSGQYVVCLDPDTGQKVWETRYDWAWQPGGAYPGPYATPTWYRGKIFYSSPTGIVGCLDAKTGDSLWSLNAIEKFKGKGSGFGYAATPLVEDDRVILPVGGPSASLVALHADDGRTLWTAGSDPASYCPAFPLTFRGRRCIVGYLENSLILVEAASGKVLHRQSLSSGYDEHSAWPLYREPHLLLTRPFRMAAERLELQPGLDDTVLCRPQWKSKELCNDVASSVLSGDHVYGFDLRQQQSSKHRTSRGEFRCLEWATGKVCWSTDRVGHASVLAADGKLFLLSDTGDLILARADPAEYRELGRTLLFEDETCWTQPTLWQGRLFVRSPSRAVCLDVGRSPSTPNTTAPVPPVRPWRLDAAWLLTREREFPNDAPAWEEMLLWFGASLVLVFGGAALVSGLLWLVLKRLVTWQVPWSPVFLGVAFVLGLLGPNVFSSLLDRCLFTWPASLYTAFQVAMMVSCRALDHRGDRRAGWLARLAILGFVLVGYGYFELCKAVGMFVAWSFLFGFPAAFPFAYLAARAERKRQRAWVVAGWTLLGFAAYFWSCQALLLWKAAQTE